MQLRLIITLLSTKYLILPQVIRKGLQHITGVVINKLEAAKSIIYHYNVKGLNQKVVEISYGLRLFFDHFFYKNMKVLEGLTERYKPGQVIVLLSRSIIINYNLK